jgi:hypothetical protein
VSREAAGCQVTWCCRRCCCCLCEMPQEHEQQPAVKAVRQEAAGHRRTGAGGAGAVAIAFNVEQHEGQGRGLEFTPLAVLHLHILRMLSDRYLVRIADGGSFAASSGLNRGCAAVGSGGVRWKPCWVATVHRAAGSECSCACHWCASCRPQP